MERDGSVLITGATGMLGGLLVKRMLEEDAGRRILLLVRNVAKARELYRDLRAEDYRRLRFIPYRTEESYLPDCGLPEGEEGREPGIEGLCPASCPELYRLEFREIIHCACVTQSEEMFAYPVETADSIVYGTRNVLELARKRRVDSMVFLSSMEVYGKVEDNGETSKEEELGSLDLSSVRNCYPLAKRMAEHYCHIYQKEYGVPVKIARLSQTFGRGVRPEDQRIYMQFARAVQEKKDIVLHTYGKSVGNYCHTQDAVEAVLCILRRGRDGETYNVVNEENTMSVREMAELVIQNFTDGEVKIVYDVSEENQKIYAVETGLRLSAEKLRALGWTPKRDLVQMYRELLEMRL